MPVATMPFGAAHTAFLLPLVFVYCAVGIVAMIDFLPREALRAPIAVVTGIVMIAVIAGNVVAERSVTDTDQNSSADEIAVLLKDKMGPGDLAVCTVPTSAPLEYYFLKHGISLQHLNYRSDAYTAPERLWIITTRIHCPEVARLLKGTPWEDHPNLPGIAVVQSYPYATLYELDVRSP